MPRLYFSVFEAILVRKYSEKTTSAYGPCENWTRYGHAGQAKQIQKLGLVHPMILRPLVAPKQAVGRMRAPMYFEFASRSQLQCSRVIRHFTV